MTHEPTRVVVLGGTFDPVHNGHLELVRGAVDELAASEAWLIPAATPNLRDPPVASAADRYDLLLAATRGMETTRVLDIELRRPGISYTIDTVVELEQMHPGVEAWWLIGSDAMRRVGGWHRSAELLERARFAVVQRAGSEPFGDEDIAAIGARPAVTRVLNFVPPMVEATEVRARVGVGEPVNDLVPEAVASLIVERGLYLP